MKIFQNIYAVITLMVLSLPVFIGSSYLVGALQAAFMADFQGAGPDEYLRIGMANALGSLVLTLLVLALFLRQVQLKNRRENRPTLGNWTPDNRDDQDAMVETSNYEWDFSPPFPSEDR